MKKILSVLMPLVLISFCTVGWAEEAAINVGLIAELTGDMPAVGASCKNAAEMAVKEINDAGGLQVGGKKAKLLLIVEDNAGKADQSAAAAQKLITQDEVIAIIGPNASRYAIPAAEVAESSGTILITPWSTNPKATLDTITNQPKKYIFRAAFIDPFQGKVLAKFAREEMKAVTAAALYDVASDYNKGIAEVFKERFEKLGGKVVAFETYTTNDKDFSAQLTKIKSAHPDVIFLPNYYSEVPLQVQQAHRLGITAPFLG
ncbi:MAG: ABC transporter substrate-binding protein, partial [Desulfobacteraceae bacterium]|nr:ABC transporter substrate-binding protein [Desulfobacteraceae bacterium]